MEPMAKLVPRLWPFLAHSSSSVRRSTLQTLFTLTRPSQSENSTNNTPSTNGDKEMRLNYGVKDWPTELVQDSLRHVFQRVLVEHLEDVQNLAVKVWDNIVEHSELSCLLHAVCPWISSWLCLAMQPPRLAFDPNTLVTYRSMHVREVKMTNRGDLESNSSVVKPMQKFYLGGTETIPVDVRGKNITRARCKAAQMLGEFTFTRFFNRIS